MIALLLSLVLLSCIVVPIRDLVNILFSSSTTAFQYSHMDILPFLMNIDIDNNIIRGRPNSSSKNSLRESSILSNTSSIAYYKYIEALNNILPNEVQNLSNSLQLSYTSNNLEKEKGKQISKAADNSLQGKILHIINEILALNKLSNT